MLVSFWSVFAVLLLLYVVRCPLYMCVCVCHSLVLFSSYLQDAFLFVFGLLLGVFAKKGGFMVDGCNNKQYSRDARRGGDAHIEG